MKKITLFVKRRKVLTAIIVIAILGLSYWLYTRNSSTTGQTLYSVAKVSRGNVETTISGTGQVSAYSQIELKSKASGDIVYLNTKANGTEVKKGTLIAQIDTRDADISLESAKLAYAKLTEPADASTMLQAQNNLNDAIQSNTKSYSDGFTAIVDAFIDFPTVMSGLNDIFYSRNGYLQTENIRSIGSQALDLQSKAGMSYDKAKNHYDNLIVGFKNISNTSSTSTIESFVFDTYILAKEISEVIKNTQSAVNFVKDQKNDTTGTTAENTVATWTNTINSDLTSLLSAKNTIANSTSNVVQQALNLQKTKIGATELELASQDLQLRQAENTYQNYFIRAPFDGVLARLLVKPTDTLSSGTSVGTLLSSQKIITITLNEVDVAKVHVNQKSIITFDAIDGLTVDGTVTAVDLVGTVSQGVVNYNVEIALDAQDDRVKSGMSASASIITESKSDVVKIPNSAVKTQKSPQGTYSYVEVFNPPLIVNRNPALVSAGIASVTAPTKKKVEIGLIDDTNTEIVSGLEEGEQVVTKTIVGTATTAAKTTASAIRTTTTSTRSATGMFGGSRPPGN